MEQYNENKAYKLKELRKSIEEEGKIRRAEATR